MKPLHMRDVQDCLREASAASQTMAGTHRQHVAVLDHIRKVARALESVPVEPDPERYQGNPNYLRGEVARYTLDHYACQDPEADTAQHVRDALINLMHLCRNDMLDFDECLSTATDHFSEEATEEN